MKFKRRGVWAALAAVFASSGATAQAQSEEDAQGKSQAIEEVVVTGSNIRSRNKDFQTPSPIQTVGLKEIADTGAVQVQDIFKGITANSGSQLLQDVTNLQGTSQFSLRGLGVGSTLTLINGRRAGLAPVVDNSGQLFTDANQYPINMIERVEVLTDGASSTYGSEAVAGVVNIFTRDKFEGFEFGGEFRDTTNQSAQLNAAFGVQGERGGLTIFANYYTQDSATRSDFPNFADGNRLEDGIAGGFDSVTGSPGRFNQALPDASVAGGFARAGGPSTPDPDCVEAGGLLDVAAGNCRYHFLDQRRIFPEEDRFQLFSSANYDVSDRLNIFGEFGFSRNDIRDGNGGLLTRQFTNDGGFLVPGDHPFNFFVADAGAPGGIRYAGPEAFAADSNLEAVDLIYRGRPRGSDADGPNQADISTIFTNTRIVGGFDLELNDNWLLYGSYVWANSDFERTAPREWDIPVFAEQIVAGAWNPFGTRIVSPDLVSPKDGVSVAGNSNEVESLFSLFRNDVALVRQSVAEVSLSGETGIQLGGGPIAVAFGGQYRDIELEDVPDGRYQSGDNRLNETVPAVFGEQDVYAFFGEAHFPVTDWLEIQTAVRFEDYAEQGGDTLDPKISFKADLNSSLSLRASYGTSFQAPSIRQVAGIIGNGTVTDPGPAPGETLGQDSIGDNVIVTIVTEGSDDLIPQSAENFNIGLVYRPDWGLDLSLDWFYYDYQDLILQDFAAQQVFDLVAAGDLDSARVLRSPDGQASTAISNFVNGGSAEVGGFDLVAAYRTDVGEGGLLIDVKSTLLYEFESSEFGDILGNRNFRNGFGSTPDFRFNVGATYDYGQHRFNVTVRHIGDYTDDQSNSTVDSNTTIDLRYDVELNDLVGGEGTSLSVGVVNLQDKIAPRLIDRPFFDTEVHDPRGRQLYLSFKQSF
ncbi:TonB-dependent receptor plug domain-containing protein [Porticoccus sp. GXU_MW_L64]